jgi:hypothetical protein
MNGRNLLAAILVFEGLANVACKPTKSEQGRTMDSAPTASATPSFGLRGEFFELPLPAGWGAHPQQAKMEDFGAVNGRYELIVATHTIDVATATARGLSFDDVLRQLAEIRRSATQEYAADPTHVEPAQAQMLGEIPVLAFRARLSRAPFAGVTQICILIGVPGVRTGTTSKRPVLTISIYDHQGGRPDELFAFSRDLLTHLDVLANRGSE